MAKRFVVLKCLACGKRVRCSEELLPRVLEGKARCPKCKAKLQVTKDSTGQIEEERLGGKLLTTRKDALLNVTLEGEVAVAQFTTSRLRDLMEVRQLDEELNELLERVDANKFVLDFEQVSFMSSSVIGVLVKFLKKVQERGGQLKLCSMSHEIGKVIKIMRLDKVFDLRRSRSDALSALRKSK